MAIDILAYNQALEEFLVRMEKINGIVNGDTHVAMDKLCRILRIARVELVYYENMQKERMNSGKLVVFYSQGEFSRDRKLFVREVTGAGSAAHYNIYQYTNEAPWSEEELNKVRVFQKALFTFNGRASMMKQVDERTYTDMQLGMPNIAQFMRFTSMMIAKGQINDFGAVFFNLKRFSVVNDQIGRNLGTLVMKKYIAQLQKKLKKPGLVVRVGGDNFAAIFLKSDLEVVRRHLHGEGVIFNEVSKERVLVCSVAGFYIVDENDKIRTPEDIMDKISISMNVAKNSHGTDEIFFNENLMHRQSEMKRIESLFPDAMANEEFKVYYQPKISLERYNLVGAEALCRWERDGKLVPPSDFIPVFEQSMNICKLDFYMLAHVCADIRRWLDEGVEPVKVSVNLSRRHLGDMDLLNHILQIIDSYDVPYKYIEIELTETTTDVEFKDLKRVVYGLQERGISTSVDDFGIGYSSLNLIREIPWNVLKIDKSFLPVIGQSRKNEMVMLKHVIAMAQDMGLECIVEGVETLEQVKLLKKNNCYLAQGFYFDRPMPVKQFEERLKKKDESFFPEEDLELDGELK
ncbi:MAG: EAL domain-containing protein [Lachnospiraceae bacterium]|nr:EAL domain-containing protein [Lachnospiraceae bacterium]